MLEVGGRKSEVGSRKSEVGGRKSEVGQLVAQQPGGYEAACGTGWAFGDGASYQCFPRDPQAVRRPDASYLTRSRLGADELPRDHCPVAPVLAVEVVSPNDTFCELEQKVRDYLAAGVELVWILDP